MGIQSMIKHALSTIEGGSGSNPAALKTWERRVKDVAHELEYSSDTERKLKFQRLVANIVTEVNTPPPDNDISPATSAARRKVIIDAEIKLDELMAPLEYRDSVLENAIENDEEELGSHVKPLYSTLLPRNDGLNGMPAAMRTGTVHFDLDMMFETVPDAKHVKAIFMNVPETGYLGGQTVVAMGHLEDQAIEPRYWDCDADCTFGELLQRARVANTPPSVGREGEHGRGNGEDKVTPDIWIKKLDIGGNCITETGYFWEYQGEAAKIRDAFPAPATGDQLEPRRLNVDIVSKEGDYIVALVNENGEETGKTIDLPVYSEDAKLTIDHIRGVFPEHAMIKTLDLRTGEDVSQMVFSKLHYPLKTNTLYIELQSPIPDLTGLVTKGRLIFDGTYSRVYEGLFNNSKAAIKVLRTMRDSKKTERKFRRECYIWSRLYHPNILPFCGYYGFVDGYETFPALVSEWAERGSAAYYILSDHLSWTQRINLLYDVAKGLQYMHLHTPSIVHGDLKPLNVLIDRNGVAQLCDFGLASLIADELETGMTTTSPHSGTTRYLAYELVEFKGKAVLTMFSDVYALGCLAYEFLYRLPPYADLEIAWKISRAISEGISPAKRPTQLGEDLSLFWDLIEACWDMNPTSRPTTEGICTYLGQSIQPLSEAFSAALSEV